MNRTRKQRLDERLVIISNRLPIIFHHSDGHFDVKPGEGGLVAALTPVLRDRGGLWIGWPGTHDVNEANLDAMLAEHAKTAGYLMKSVQLSREEVERYYLGFSNELIWPLFHGFDLLCNFDPTFWKAYVRVNKKFADVVHAHTKNGDYIWVHDYHLMNVARDIRDLGRIGHIGFFLHIPFPTVDIFSKMPWRREVLDALLHYDLLGFQTVRDRQNFIGCVHELMPDAKTSGKSALSVVTYKKREIRVGAFPIGIDYESLAARADAPEVTTIVADVKRGVMGRKLILGVDRLDYSKGIPFRFRAFRNALARYPSLRGMVTYVQVVVPSRDNILEYQALKADIERLVGEINGAYSRPGWVPLHYYYRSLEPAELLAYYRASDIALVTPLKDGMNLVAKEYCAANLEHNGALILSEFAGAASQLDKWALVVNPYDIIQMADAIHTAVTMTDHDRYTRMKHLRESIHKHDIFQWVDNFLRVGLGTEMPSSSKIIPIDQQA